MNSLVEELPKYAEIIKNDVLENTYTLHKGQYWFNSYRYDGSVITVNIYDDLESQYLYFSKTFHLHSNNINIFKEKGNIKLK
jgi:hypothetical protein